MGLCKCDLDDFFAYKTTREVRIRDRRLGLARLAIVIGVFVYIIVFETIINAGYLKFESPEGIVVSSLRRGTDRAAGFPEYCAPGQVASDGKQPCKYLDEGAVLFPEGEEHGSMFITTRMTEMEVPLQTGCSSPSYVRLANGNMVLRGDAGQACAKPPTIESAEVAARGGKSWYVGDVDDFTIMWQHAVYGPRTDNLKTSVNLHYGDLFWAGELPPMHTHGDADLGDHHLEFVPRVSDPAVIRERLDHPNGGWVGTDQGDIMAVKVLIDALSDNGTRFNLDLPSLRGAAANCGAGIDFNTRKCAMGCNWVGPYCDGATKPDCEFDSRCVFDANNRCTPKSNDTSFCTRNSYRFDGALIMVLIDYATPFQKQNNLGYTYRPVLIRNVAFKTIQRMETATGVKFTMRRGVRVLFVQTGLISQFSFVELLKTLVSGVALLSIAKVVIELVLMKCLKNKEVYHNYKYLTSKDFSEVNPTDEDPNGGLHPRDYVFGVDLQEHWEGNDACPLPPPKETEPVHGAGSVPELSGASRPAKKKDGEGDVDVEKAEPQSHLI